MIAAAEAHASQGIERNAEEDGGGEPIDAADGVGEEDDRNDEEVVNAQQEGEEEEEEALPAIMGQDDPRRMQLTREESDWALDIKDAVESLAELDNMSDLMYAQLAIICHDDIPNAIRRAYGLQEFRQEYKILDNLEEGCHRLRGLVDMFPEEFLSFSFSEQESIYVLIHDLSKLNFEALKSPKDVHRFFAGAFYLHTIFCPDLASIRKGMLVMIECEAMDWSKKPSFKVLSQLSSQLLTIYPFIGYAYFYHTGVFINMMASMLRKLLPKNLGDRLRTGMRFDDRLDKCFLVPDVETATQKVISEMEKTLKRRYENEKAFILHDYE